MLFSDSTSSKPFPLMNTLSSLSLTIIETEILEEAETSMMELKGIKVFFPLLLNNVL